MFAKIIKALCDEKGITLSKLALDIGCSATTATGWKRGSVPKHETLTKIANYFGVSVKYLRGEPDQPPKAAFSTNDKEIGRLEGRIEQLEKQVQGYETRISEVLNTVAEMLRDKKTTGKRQGMGNAVVHR
jgi:transcriptional regulator with XRE-family HTH domain